MERCSRLERAASSRVSSGKRDRGGEGRPFDVYKGILLRPDEFECLLVEFPLGEEVCPDGTLCGRLEDGLAGDIRRWRESDGVLTLKVHRADFGIYFLNIASECERVR